jgi:hypothetical protein
LEKLTQHVPPRDPSLDYELRFPEMVSAITRDVVRGILRNVPSIKEPEEDAYLHDGLS